MFVWVKNYVIINKLNVRVTKFFICMGLFASTKFYSSNNKRIHLMVFQIIVFVVRTKSYSWKLHTAMRTRLPSNAAGACTKNSRNAARPASLSWSSWFSSRSAGKKTVSDEEEFDVRLFIVDITKTRVHFILRRNLCDEFKHVVEWNSESENMADSRVKEVGY